MRQFARLDFVILRFCEGGCSLIPVKGLMDILTLWENLNLRVLISSYEEHFQGGMSLTYTVVFVDIYIPEIIAVVCELSSFQFWTAQGRVRRDAVFDDIEV